MMLTRLIQFALAQRLFLMLAGALLAGAGWFAFTNLPIDAFPDVSSTHRHFVEFFQCLIGQAHDGGSINYDLRRRDHQIEANPAFAAACIRRILVELPTLPMGMETQLEASYDLNGTRGFSISTSLERELMYNVEHTIHHLALVKIGLRLVVPEYVVPQHFGVAVSTIKYQQSIEKGLPRTLVGHA